MDAHPGRERGQTQGQNMHQQKSGIQRALKALVISTMMVLMTPVAHALEVGKLFVYSRLDTPLEAEIELLSVTEDEIDSLLPSVAPPAHFSVAELENQPEIKVTVAERADGQYVLRLSSEESLSEPILQFTLHTVWSAGHLVHDFSALVDPPAPNTVTNAAKERQEVSTGVDEPKPEFIPQPEQPAASAQQPSSASSEPASAPAVLAPPRVLVEIPPRGQDQSPTTTEQSTVTSSNKLDELGDSTEAVNPPIETEVVHRVAEQTIAQTQRPLVQTQPQISRDEPRALTPEYEANGTQRAKPAQPITPATVPKEQGMVYMVSEFVREHPRWVLVLVAILVGGFMLIAGALVSLVVNLRRHNTTRQFQKKAPAPKVAVPTKAPEDESHTNGNGRRDIKRRRQGRRASSDRRKVSKKVAFDRRSGLYRRRSEILDGGLATVSSEALDPIAEADVYLSAGSYDHAEATVREALVTEPTRQELKVKLLQIYHLKGDLLTFNALAEELREVLDGPSSRLWKNLEANGWHLDGPIDDADAAQEEIVLELAEQERVNGDAAPDVDTNAKKAEVELDSYTIEFESQPQNHTVVNTLKDAFNEFLQARKGLKARTIDNYKQMMEASFVDWHKKTLLEISEDMVAERHQELWQEHGKVYANRAMRCLRTMYNFFSTHYRDASGKSLVPENPVKSLTHIQS